MTLELKRGEQNHNPFDLEDNGTPWQGMTGKDGPFCVFADDAHGLRAGFRDLHTAWAKDGRRDIAAIVTPYAPPAENDTAAYIAAVVQRMNAANIQAGPDHVYVFDADTPLHLDDDVQLLELGKAVIEQEQGRCIYAAADLVVAVNAALGKS